MQLISKLNKWFRLLLCVIDIYSKYTRVSLLKDIKGITITNVCKSVLVESNLKPNKRCVDKGSEFYNKSMKSFLQNNNIVIYYSTNHEGKLVIAERFIKTLKNKIDKHMTSVSKHV